MRAFFLILAIIFLSTNLYSQNLDTVWTKIYDFKVSERDSYNVCNGILTSDSCVVLVGLCYIFENNSDVPYYFIVKLSRDGDTLWTKKLGVSNYSHYWPIEITETLDSCVVIMSFGANSLEHSLILVKINLMGHLIWEKCYSLENGSSGVRDISETKDGGFMVLGSDPSGKFLVKLNSSGDSLWITEFSTRGSLDLLVDVSAIDDDGALISRLYSFENPRTDSLCITRIDSLGSMEWEICYDYSGEYHDYYDHELFRLCEDTFSLAISFFPNSIVNVYRFSVDGNKLDTVSYHTGIKYWLYDTFIDNEKNIYLVSGCGSNHDFHVIKLNGNLEFQYSELIPHDLGMYGTFICKDLDGYIYVAGNTTEDNNFVLMKLVEQIPVSAPEDEIIVPSKYRLSQNYPNPFNPSTRIDYAVESKAHVIICVYNSLGQLVQTLVDNEKPAGQHSITWNGLDSNGKQAATGVYFYRVSIGDYIESKKMMLLK